MQRYVASSLSQNASFNEEYREPKVSVILIYILFLK